MMKKEIVIIGSGAAGLQAAIYAARRKADVLVLGKIESSSLWNAEIENYFGLDGVVPGKDLLMISKEKAEKFGVNFLEEDVVLVKQNPDADYILSLESGQEISTKAIIITTGVSRKKLGVKGEQEFVGKGVSYCVDCDGMFFKNKDVVITGNGSSAASGALVLSQIANQVYFVSENLNIAPELLEKIKNNTKIKNFESKKITEIFGDNSFVNGVSIDDGSTLNINGVFIEFGAKGAFDLFADFGIELDKKTFKHIQVNERQMTNINGIFAAGDITGAPYQVAKAVGQGCIAGIEAVEYVEKI